jgi:hypothetical protein
VWEDPDELCTQNPQYQLFLFDHPEKIVQRSQRSPRELKKKLQERNCYLGTIAELPIEAPCMDQVVLKGTKTIKENLPERKMQSKIGRKKKNTLPKQGDFQIEFMVNLILLLVSKFF